jgi:hypothetical protein
MTEPTWNNDGNTFAPPTDAPPTAVPIASTGMNGEASAGATMPKRGRGRPPLTDAQRAERKAAIAAKARERRAAVKGTASTVPTASRRRGRPAKAATVPTDSAMVSPVLAEIRADAARLRERIMAAVLNGTL